MYHQVVSYHKKMLITIVYTNLQGAQVRKSSQRKVR